MLCPAGLLGPIIAAADTVYFNLFLGEANFTLTSTLELANAELGTRWLRSDTCCVLNKAYCGGRPEVGFPKSIPHTKFVQALASSASLGYLCFLCQPVFALGAKHCAVLSGNLFLNWEGT